MKLEICRDMSALLRGGVTRRRRGVPSYRILFSTLPFLGHLQGQLPLARALRSAGNDVRFATSAEFAGLVGKAGFDVVPVSFRQAHEQDKELSLRTVSAGEQMFAWMPTAARVAPTLIRVFGQWRPDVVLRDPLELGSCLAAEYAGIPHGVGREGPFWDRAVLRSAVGADLDSLREQLGLPPDPATEMPYRYLAFAFMPPQLLPLDMYLPPTMHFIRPSPDDSAAHLDGTGWKRPPPDVAFVYATLGTVFNRRHKNLLEAIIDAFTAEPYEALLTTGPGPNPALSARAAKAGNLTVLSYVPQSTVLPYCDVIVAHGGFLTVMGALLHGVPMVLVPLGGDHYRNAGWLSAQGAALVLGDEQRDADSIREAVRQVMSDDSYQEAAERLQLAMTELPRMSTAVSLVEQLAGTSVPIWRHGAGQQGASG